MLSLGSPKHIGGRMAQSDNLERVAVLLKESEEFVCKILLDGGEEIEVVLAGSGCSSIFFTPERVEVSTRDGRKLDFNWSKVIHMDTLGRGEKWTPNSLPKELAEAMIAAGTARRE